jgi:hypothetical protein
MLFYNVSQDLRNKTLGGQTECYDFHIKKPTIKYRMSGETVPLMSDGES